MQFGARSQVTADRELLARSGIDGWCGLCDLGCEKGGADVGGFGGVGVHDDLGVART
jgi:hypothetical protein